MYTPLMYVPVPDVVIMLPLAARQCQGRILGGSPDIQHWWWTVLDL